nr:SAM-dependent methyltransferase [Halomonas sp. XH26]
MKPKTGRMAVVVPRGVLFRGSSEGRSECFDHLS